MKMFSRSLLSIALLSGTWLVAGCSDGSSGTTVTQVTENATLVVGATTAEAAKAILANQIVVIPSDAEAAAGTLPAGTLTLSGAGSGSTISTFSLATTDGSGNVEGDLIAGSCEFKVTKAPTKYSALVGKTLVFETCNFVLDTKGKQVADNGTVTTTVVVKLGAAGKPAVTSEPSTKTITVSINTSTGKVTVDGKEVDDVEVIVVSGGSN